MTIESAKGHSKENENKAEKTYFVIEKFDR